MVVGGKRGNMAELENKIAVITGAGRGIGQAIALAYAREGAILSLAARSASELEETAAECRKLGITIISILDTNCDPNMVDIPIPANDDAVRSIKLIISTLSDAIILGRKTSS